MEKLWISESVCVAGVRGLQHGADAAYRVVVLAVLGVGSAAPATSMVSAVASWSPAMALQFSAMAGTAW